MQTGHVNAAAMTRFWQLGGVSGASSHVLALVGLVARRTAMGAESAERQTDRGQKSAYY